ncbi:jg15779 [Pararge aegeria aegeria]|uniref:Jg15779 protein n=1 Tax=Pararge aegeria aegeria TaxID=348720 RepID=A0A8S4RKX8_9NEOP|nr:jg15779 [Pararge aegeria aegeria]
MRRSVEKPEFIAQQQRAEHSSENRLSLRPQGAGMATSGKRSFGRPQRGRWITSGKSPGVAGPKRHKTMVFGTSYKTPLSSSGRQSVYICHCGLSGGKQRFPPILLRRRARKSVLIITM